MTYVLAFRSFHLFIFFGWRKLAM